MELKTVLGTAAAAAATAALGSVASTDVRSRWYRKLDKPSFQPPGKIFGPVWTVLYTDIAVSSAFALDRLGDDQDARNRYRTALGLNLILNASWSWTFFKFHRLFPAVVVAGTLAASSVDLTRRTWTACRPAGIALLPYPAWCSFATVLSAALWRRNRKTSG